MTSKFEIPNGHELISFKGTKLIPVPSVTRTTWYGGKREVAQLPLEKPVTEKTFSVDDLPNFDSYHAVFRGEFELLGVYLYTTSNKNASISVWAVAYCQLLDREGEEWAVTKLTFRVNPNVQSPLMVCHLTYKKMSGESVRLTEIKASLIFPSKETMSDMVKSLEPGDSITIAKLASSE